VSRVLGFGSRVYYSIPRAIPARRRPREEPDTYISSALLPFLSALEVNFQPMPMLQFASRTKFTLPISPSQDILLHFQRIVRDQKMFNFAFKKRTLLLITPHHAFFCRWVHVEFCTSFENLISLFVGSTRAKHQPTGRRRNRKGSRKYGWAYGQEHLPLPRVGRTFLCLPASLRTNL
jgi:hypothetical protein